MKIVTKCNHMLPRTDGIMNNHISVLHSDDALKTLFSKNYFSTIYKRNKKLKELSPPSLYPKKANTRTSSITSWNNCDICQNYMIFDNTFICTVAGQSYFIREQINCESINVVYLKTCSKCLEQYVGSAVNFKTRFCIHKSDMNSKKERCGSARYFNSKCYHDTNILQYLKVQLIEQAYCNNLEIIEDIL